MLMSDAFLVALCVGLFCGLALTVLISFSVETYRAHQRSVAQQRRRRALAARLEAVQRHAGDGWW